MKKVGTDKKSSNISNNQPNILMIVTDQEYAHQEMPKGVKLSSRDWLKKNGVEFENYHTTHTVCTPSRATMYTGQQPPKTGMWDNTNLAWIDDLSTEIPTVGDMLREQGYYTAYKGKWHEAELPTKNSKDAMEPYGFSDYQDDGDCYGNPLDGYNKDPKTAVEANDWLRGKGKKVGESQPWFLAVNFINPHDVMYFDTDGDKSVQTRGLFPIFDAPDDEEYKHKWDTQLPKSFNDSRTQHPGGVEYYKVYCDGAYGKIPREREDLWHNHINYYINCIRDVDRHIGTVLEALEKSGQLKNTIIVFTSDHGEMAAAHGLRQKGTLAFKEVVNVPFIVVHPDGPKDVETQAVGSHVDLVPTMLGFAGMSQNERKKNYPQLNGHDLSEVVLKPTLDGPRGSSKKPGVGALMTYDMLVSYDAEWLGENAEYVLSMGEHEAKAKGMNAEQLKQLAKKMDKPDLSRRNMYRCVFDGRYKLVRYFSVNDYNLPNNVGELLEHNDVGLYDLKNDPDEIENLAIPEHDEYDEELLSQMNAKLNALINAEIGTDKKLIKLPR